jgi:hypothetical protein
VIVTAQAPYPIALADIHPLLENWDGGIEPCDRCREGGAFGFLLRALPVQRRELGRKFSGLAHQELARCIATRLGGAVAGGRNSDTGSSLAVKAAHKRATSSCAEVRSLRNCFRSASFTFRSSPALTLCPSRTVFDDRLLPRLSSSLSGGQKQRIANSPRSRHQSPDLDLRRSDERARLRERAHHPAEYAGDCQGPHRLHHRSSAVNRAALCLAPIVCRPESMKSGHRRAKYLLKSGGHAGLG